MLFAKIILKMKLKGEEKRRTTGIELEGTDSPQYRHFFDCNASMCYSYYLTFIRIYFILIEYNNK